LWHELRSQPSIVVLRETFYEFAVVLWDPSSAPGLVLATWFVRRFAPASGKLVSGVWVGRVYRGWWERGWG
jgi:hypothetical protein